MLFLTDVKGWAFGRLSGRQRPYAAEVERGERGLATRHSLQERRLPLDISLHPTVFVACGELGQLRRSCRKSAADQGRAQHPVCRPGAPNLTDRSGGLIRPVVRALGLPPVRCP